MPAPPQKAKCSSFDSKLSRDSSCLNLLFYRAVCRKIHTLRSITLLVRPSRTDRTRTFSWFGSSSGHNHNAKRWPYAVSLRPCSKHQTPAHPVFFGLDNAQNSGTPVISLATSTSTAVAPKKQKNTRTPPPPCTLKSPAQQRPSPPRPETPRIETPPALSSPPSRVAAVPAGRSTPPRPRPRLPMFSRCLTSGYPPPLATTPTLGTRGAPSERNMLPLASLEG